MSGPDVVCLVSLCLLVAAGVFVGGLVVGRATVETNTDIAAKDKRIAVLEDRIDCIRIIVQEDEAE